MEIPPHIWVRLMSVSRSRAVAWTDVPSLGIGHDGGPDDVDRDNHDIGDGGYDKDKFTELARTPGAFQVFPAIEDGGGVQQDGKDILLDEGRGEKGPGVKNNLRGNKGEVGYTGLSGRGAPGAADLVPSGDVVEQGERKEADEKDAGGRRDIDAHGHDESSYGC